MNLDLIRDLSLWFLVLFIPFLWVLFCWYWYLRWMNRQIGYQLFKSWLSGQPLLMNVPIIVTMWALILTSSLVAVLVITIQVAYGLILLKRWNGPLPETVTWSGLVEVFTIDSETPFIEHAPQYTHKTMKGDAQQIIQGSRTGITVYKEGLSLGTVNIYSSK